MNLGQLVDFVGNLLDYDPTNTAYREQLVNLLNDAQTRCLTDRPWAFAMRDRVLKVFTDGSQDIGYTNGFKGGSGNSDKDWSGSGSTKHSASNPHYGHQNYWNNRNSNGH